MTDGTRRAFVRPKTLQHAEQGRLGKQHLFRRANGVERHARAPATYGPWQLTHTAEIKIERIWPIVEAMAAEAEGLSACPSGRCRTIGGGVLVLLPLSPAQRAVGSYCLEAHSG